MDVEYRIVKVSRSFWQIERPMLNNPVWSIPTKRAVYKAVMLAALTFRAEYVSQLPTLLNHCMGTILGITRCQQWEQRLTSKTLANRFGMNWTILDIMMDKRLQWLSH